jgi:hypothetical protein
MATPITKIRAGIKPMDLNAYGIASIPAPTDVWTKVKVEEKKFPFPSFKTETFSTSSGIILMLLLTKGENSSVFIFWCWIRICEKINQLNTKILAFLIGLFLSVEVSSSPKNNFNLKISFQNLN